MKPISLSTASLSTALDEEHHRESSSPLRPVLGQYMQWSGLPPLHTRIPRKLGFGLDLGGTLSKIVFFEPDGIDDKSQADYCESECNEKAKVRAFLDQSISYGETGTRDLQLQFHSPKLGGHFTFVRFHTNNMENFLQIVRSNQLLRTRKYVLFGLLWVLHRSWGVY
jgi:hypothetical protein